MFLNHRPTTNIIQEDSNPQPFQFSVEVIDLSADAQEAWCDILKWKKDCPQNAFLQSESQIWIGDKKID